MTAAATLKAHVRRLAGAVAPWKGVVGLAYHRIGDGTGSRFDRGLWSATPEAFDRQVRWLKANYDVISPREIPYVLRLRRGRHVIVSFDDGFRDNYTDAFPILRAHRATATFFVSTGFLDAPRLPWWDELAWMVRESRRGELSLPGFLPVPLPLERPDPQRAIRALLGVYHELPHDRTGAFLDALAEATGTGRHAGPEAERLWMTWDMVRELRAGGMTIGGHSVTHPVLSRLPLEAQREEIRGCARRLEQELGAPMRVFAYPVGQPGSFDAGTRECLREAGVRIAFSYYGGLSRLDRWDPYDVRRHAVEQDTTFDEFRARVALPGWRGRR